jgi:cell division septal protein FtsQ
MLSVFNHFRKNKQPAVLRKRVVRRRLTQLQLQILVGCIIVVIIGLLVTLIYFFTRIESLQLRKVEVVGGQTIPHDAIEKVVHSGIEGSYFKIVPKRFSPLYPQDRLLESVFAFHRIKNVSIEKSADQTLTVVFDEYTPYALWCEKKDTESCLFIDTTGFAFAEAPSLEGSAFVRYVEDGVIPQTKSTSFDMGFITETEGFIENLKEKLSLYVTHVTKVGNYDIEYTISGGAVIKVSQTISSEKTFENLETILNSKEFVDINPGSFQYIDLRFGDKVFVNEAPIESATTTATTTNIE